MSRWFQHVGLVREGTNTYFVPREAPAVGLEQVDIEFKLGQPKKIGGVLEDHIADSDEYCVDKFCPADILGEYRIGGDSGNLGYVPPVHRPHKILVRRNGALGDVICAIALMQGMKKAFPDSIGRIIFWTQPKYVAIAGLSEAVNYCVPFPDPAHLHIDGLDHVAIFDGFPETDCLGAHDMSRLEAMMWSFCGFNPGIISIMQETIVPDFRLSPPEYARDNAEKFIAEFAPDKPIVCVGVKTSGNRDGKPRQMPKAWLEEVTAKLIEEIDCHVVLIDGHAKNLWKGENGDRRIVGEPTSLFDAMAIMEKADVVCTADSGLLWLSHCTSTKLVAWLGPTPAHSRICHHPLVEEGGATAVEMNTQYTEDGCKPCYESGLTCEEKFSCVRDDRYKDYFIEETLKQVKAHLNG